MTKQFTYQSANIVYHLAGTGKTVVLLHGFGEDCHIWDEQVLFLKEYFRLIIPDLPGSGASDPLREKNGQPVSIDDYAECVAALLEKEQVESCVMLGHSMGGYITLAFAEKYPLALDGFGLIHSTAFADNEEKKANRLRGIEIMDQYGGASFLRNTIPNLFGEKYKRTHPEMIEGLIRRAAAFKTPALQQYYMAMMQRPDRTAVLSKAGVPVLFIIGTEDVAAPMKDVLQQARLPLKSYIHIIEGGGHMSMWEATTELNNYMLAYINGL
ncbi:alpha/beta fold hydrolase [Sediminibacterium ginsengisoli]|uniref:Pimeloyl-ACP methyl ester carboxylesterase n=1 Tax=Sediminibacterium ginsengisoli TaxID=413434 RepID=A0A1T4K7V1_9BACT|nr:alpha/beta hydrolase [Sediminibacterium ginsengisoli]SJZ38395.1 Pimeloyl-ACP methyl ester carboxylesterase [Sediminibacterium ginsengisoli]